MKKETMLTEDMFERDVTKQHEAEFIARPSVSY